MKKIMYENCNDNAAFLKELFLRIQALSVTELSWNISNLEFISANQEDFVGGIPNLKMEKLYNFQKKTLEEYTVSIMHGDFMELLGDIKTIYEGDFATLINGKHAMVKIFDGDIIEIDGEIENICE